MKLPKLFACAALAALSAAALSAQQAPSGFHTVACVKVKPDKGSEFQKWSADTLHKLAQSGVDSGAYTTWYLLRSVDPVGTSAECDYVVVYVYPGAPPEPPGNEELGAALEKAGLNMSAQEFVDRRAALSTLVSRRVYRNVIAIGSVKKGNYFVVNYMKTANLDDYLAMEQKVWKPIAEQMIKDGVQSAWSVNYPAFGLPADMPYQAVSVDIYPSWDAVYKEDPQFMDRIKKVYPDKDMNALSQQIEKSRTMVSRQLYVLDDMITSSKPTVSSGHP